MLCSPHWPPLRLPGTDVFLGLLAQTAQNVRSMVQTMKTVQAQDWTPQVEAAATVGKDTLVMWTWPLKGTHGIGLQVYGPDGGLRTRLEDSEVPSARAVVCGDRYVVGGGNTLRVWDAARDYALVAKRTYPKLGQFAALSCTGGVLNLLEGTRVTRLLVPSLKPVDLRLGLNLNRLDEPYTVTQTLKAPAGDMLVA